MGILDTIKSKVLRRGETEDIPEIRSHIVGDNFDNEKLGAIS